MKYISHLFILFIILISNNTLAGTIDPNTPDHKYTDYAKDFIYVTQVCGVYEDKSLFCGSGVLIQPNWALTAAHVVNKSIRCSIKTKEHTSNVVKIFIPEEWEDKFGVADIALCKMQQSININFYPELYDKDDEVNKLVSISGFGLTGNFISGAILSDNKKRAGSNFIDYIDRELLICSPSKNTKEGKKTALEFLIASGDSGGGLFIENKLAGINSCLLANNTKVGLKSDYNNESGHTRVSLYRKWILETIESEK